MSHIFISYSKKDTRKLAFDLADALNAISGITAWVDRSLKAGPSWEAQIEREILRCDYFVVLYSPDINRHLQGEDESYVLTEIDYAKRTAKKPIIPVMAQVTTPPISLTRAHYIDYTYPDLTVADLVEAICAEIGVDSVATHNSAPMLGVKSAKLLPAPFAWIPIPAGKVTLTNTWDDNKNNEFLKKGQSKTVEVPAFAIAKYLITNAQFRLFVDAGGYNHRQWWTEEGWAQREQEKWTEPCYWTDSKWNGVNQPVVGVSWYESLAFCRWLSEQCEEKITLPNEAQWQRAAQGDDERMYPWGDDWDANRCNNNVAGKGIGKTTPVTQYEGKGDSPFKVVDMSGNVWEWCLTAYYTGNDTVNGTDIRVLRGGSWNDFFPDYFRCVFRIRNYPHNRTISRGFRLVLS